MSELEDQCHASHPPRRSPSFRLASQTEFLRASWFVKLAPVQALCSRVLRASYCHASPVRDARLPCDSDSKQNRLRFLVSRLRSGPSALLTTAQTLRNVTLRIGRMAGEISPATSQDALRCLRQLRPSRIRSGLIPPMRLSFALQITQTCCC